MAKTQRVRECSDRATPLINVVHRSPTTAALQALVTVERDVQTELEALFGVIEAVDEPKNDPHLMTHMCLSQNAARGSDINGFGEGSSRIMGDGSAGVGRSARYNGRRKVRLRRDGQGGLGIAYGRADADSNEPYFVTGLTAERPGHLCGEITVGDVLAQIDGHDIAPLLGTLRYVVA